MAEEKSSRLDEASNRIRETAKWLTVSLAVLGGVLTAGTQLSGVGSLTLWSPRFWVAVLGGTLAAAGVVVILLKAVGTATTPAVSFATLTPSDDLDNNKFLTHHTNVNDLRSEFLKKIEERRQAAAEFSTNPNTATKMKLESANADWDFLQKIVGNVLQVASYDALAESWKKATKWIAGAAIVAGIGVVMFVWAINPPAASEASSASPGVLSPATTGKVVLTAAGQSAVRARLGAACADKSELAVLHLDDTASGPDVLVQEPGCNAVRLVLGSDWGSLSK